MMKFKVGDLLQHKSNGKILFLVLKADEKDYYVLCIASKNKKPIRRGWIAIDDIDRFYDYAK